MLDVVLKERHRDQGDAMNQHPRARDMDREDRVSWSPYVCVSHDLNLGTRFLF